ncbi:hypothetical protein ACX1DX_09855 [Tessaracoccus sp. Y36]
MLIRAALPHMYAQGFGRIINISSVHGLVASPLEGGAHGVTSVRQPGLRAHPARRGPGGGPDQDARHLGGRGDREGDAGAGRAGVVPRRPYGTNPAASLQGLGYPWEKTNLHGGALALGHPVGASGARLALHAAMELHRRGAGRAGVALCGGGGQGEALLLSADS